MTKAPKTAGNRHPSAAERALWDAATRDVTRSSEALLGDDDVPALESAQRTVGDRQPPRRANGAPADDTAMSRSTLPELSHGAAPGLDTRSRMRLRRGQIDIEARIDLHGLTQTEAHRALGAFLADAQRRGRRAVLVITGKGLTKRGEVGVLRREVPRWLNQMPMRQRVRAFSYASPRDGGEGALYILLRRDR